MPPEPSSRIRVLAIDPIRNGFGFAVLEGQEILKDWGVKNIRADKHTQCLRRIIDLMSIYQPDAIILENVNAKMCRRCERVCELLHAVRTAALVRNIDVYKVSRREVLSVFSPLGGGNKHQIATLISMRLPALAPELPPFRKIWMSEDVRMSIFDAVAFALTFFTLGSQKDPL